MGKKIKKEKEIQQRAFEVENLLRQIMELGFPLDHEGVQAFSKICKEFEHDGISASGSIRMTGFQRTIEYILSVRPHIESRIILKYNAHV